MAWRGLNAAVHQYSPVTGPSFLPGAEPLLPPVLAVVTKPGHERVQRGLCCWSGPSPGVTAQPRGASECGNFSPMWKPSPGRVSPLGPPLRRPVFKPHLSTSAFALQMCLFSSLVLVS